MASSIPRKRLTRVGFAMSSIPLDHLPLFQPFPQTGLDAEVVERVSMYLNGSSDQTMRRGLLQRAFQNVRSVFNRDKS
jgi:hypothetical protein